MRVGGREWSCVCARAQCVMDTVSAQLGSAQLSSVLKLGKSQMLSVSVNTHPNLLR